ncbi:transferase, Chloramphenicol acetyltransferase-like domain protein [Artemisia annua]|uniref:Transferase, Chloramphenicol acetyltransferase-like domain protein n=1 Tax=Artemisia annua TaxID=35608 RepID=A0A2U1Q864_ARTAN|nr:transferase, Chloramphenicol acetyltransferase-like domain protein [Artemisia annua]
MLVEKLLRLGRRQLHTIISREIIKPSSPTPSHLNPYNLSPIDQLAQQAFMPMVLLYPNNGNGSLSAHDKARLLKESLSHSLKQYYPFSGRLPTPKTPYVNCNDEGVVFVEARNEHQLDMFQRLSEHDESLDKLFPDDLVCHNSPHSTNLIGVQLNHFACGGLGLAISLSHLIGDGCTIGSFLSHWASVARYGSTDHKEVQPLNPHILSSPFPTSTLPDSHVINKGYANRVTKKFVFPNSKLIALKNEVIAMAAAGSTQPIKNPTRVEVLTSLLYKSAVAAATKKSGCFKPSYLFMPVDIRKKFVQKLPQTAMGNFVSVMMVPTRVSSEVSLSVLVSGIKKEKLQLEGIPSLQQAADNMKILQSKLLANENLEDVINRSYWCSSLCGFPYDKMDFGWGKPTGTTLALRSADRIGFLLMDTPDGDGIEAPAILEKEDMKIFENDKHMLSFCH